MSTKCFFHATYKLGCQTARIILGQQNKIRILLTAWKDLFSTKTIYIILCSSSFKKYTRYKEIPNCI